MKSAAKSVYFFGFYLIGLGLILMSFPNFILSLFQFDLTEEVWIRVVGVLALVIGIYYIRTAPSNDSVFLKTTVLNRILVLVCFMLFSIFGWAKVTLILFGLVDFLGAIWTWSALKKEKA
ncbi:MAG: hypothetical protein K1X92_11170 [Bacteroidia bacterium]|nr:hypothetical protein [Bacteroidia bacterium]